jgi:hypothetical protein
MRVAIIGSRRWTDRAAVEACVAGLPHGTVVVSGGAAGPDSWAADAAARRGLVAVVHRPDLAGVHCYGEAAQRYRERNQHIVEDCDRLIAFVAPDRPVGAKGGGTQDAIRRALRAGKLVEIR